MLPRKGSAAISLLGSIDFGRDYIEEPGLRDWEFLEPSLRKPAWWYLVTAHCLDCCTDFVSSVLYTCSCISSRHHFSTAFEHAVTELHNAHCIYVLSSFIESHQRAQKTIPYYLGEEEKVCFKIYKRLVLLLICLLLIVLYHSYTV